MSAGRERIFCDKSVYAEAYPTKRHDYSLPIRATSRISPPLTRSKSAAGAGLTELPFYFRVESARFGRDEGKRFAAALITLWQE